MTQVYNRQQTKFKKVTIPFVEGSRIETKFEPRPSRNFSIVLPADIEVDSDEDKDFGTLHRVWKSWELLGTFYQNLDGKWVIQVTQVQLTCLEFESYGQAVLMTLAATGNLFIETKQ